MSKIKVGIVNYLNTAPLIYGLQNGPIEEEITLIPDYPANLARDLKDGAIDLGLVPVAIIPELKQWFLNGSYCIGSTGPVASVCLFSEVSLEKVERVLLDYQSRTSAELAKLLLRDYWKLTPEFVAAKPGFQDEIRGNTAGLVIGDRSFGQRLISPYIFDLGEAWKAHTGLPFVFAAWVSNKPLDQGFVRRFDEANALGLNNLDKVIASHPYKLFDLRRYYTQCISYNLDEAKKQGLERFLHNFAPNLKNQHG
ncbi:MAG: menaquinone biosynthesis protein [Chitinophagaceae bacterium]|nr:menaquinone biosynthesis protein [Chitinophagaceae bacterium]